MLSKSSLQQLVVAALLGQAFAAQGALTDISNAPLLVSFGVPVKPNVMLVLDNSGSMEDNFLPEAASYSSVDEYGYRSAQCNGLAFDPNELYNLPLNADGTERTAGNIATAFDASLSLGNVRKTTNVNFTVAKGDIVLTVDTWDPKSSWYVVGAPVTVFDPDNPRRWMVGDVVSWSTGSKQLKINVVEYSKEGDKLTTVRVGNGHPQFVYFKYTGAVTPSLAWLYKSDGSVDTGSTIYKECRSKQPNSPGSGVFSRVVLTELSPEAQRLANWWQHYSNRMKMMQTIVSRAFIGINEKFRVGFSRINDKTAKESTNKWLEVRDFDTTQKTKFYNSLFAATPSGYTPLRGALSLAGKYFAKKGSGQVYDPIQYSCQKNFVILSTDGAWNDDAEDGTFGPYDLSGSGVGDRDGGLGRPYFDSSQKGNTLADVAQYYYSTDLRTSALNNCTGSLGKDVCENDVKVVGKDTATHQHLTTFTLSLGQNGSLKYCDGYETKCLNETDRLDYRGILGEVEPARNWPNPFSNVAFRIDDLWHAAVNGRGTYFNASDPAAVARGLKSALEKIDEVSGSGAAGATSTIEPVSGNNLFFIGRYTSGEWSGDLRAHSIDLETGAPAMTKIVSGKSVDDYIWSAAEKLKTQSTRKILYAKGATLKELSYSAVNDDGFGADFNGKCSSLSQFAGLTPEEKAACNDGANMVDFIRGKDFPYYRARKTPLADIVGSAPMYDGKLASQFEDAGYAAYKATRGSRKEVVYVGSNGGMLHAFDGSSSSADGGKELWAFIPSAVRSRLYKLADQDYASKHEFYVDGPTIIGDAKIGGEWRTVLVGGLGAGGKAYYALDVTDPANPKLLWEFTDLNLGFTHAKPVITKRTNGTWVVAVPSGFNNTGDGKGHLFLIDLASGAKLVDIATSEGNASTPAGLGPVVGWIDKKSDNTSLRYYAGDNLGNLWRFDTEGLVEPKNAAHRLAFFKTPSGAQPITVFPKAADLTVGGVTNAVVFVGTGRLVGTSDLSNVDVQSIYAVKDLLTSDTWGDYRTLIGTKVVKQAITSTPGDPSKNIPATRTSTTAPVIWTDMAGWAVDMPDAGERINVPMNLVGTTLVAASNIPKTISSCEEGSQGTAWLYFLDIATGGATFTHYPSSMLAGTNFYLIKGKPVVLAVPTTGNPTAPSSMPSQTYLSTKARRANWREVMDK